MDDDDFHARGYQLVLAEQAISENKIIFLPTGSGKTFISLMVLKHCLPQLSKPFIEGGKRAFFLVNQVALVDQQADVIKRHTHLEEVGRYSGDMNLDGWSHNNWREQFIEFEVLVMTAEILHQLILKNFINFKQLALLIFDECHHAVDDHPMRQIMRLMESCPVDQQPRVLGLTASLLNATPKTLLKVANEVKELEITYHATIATVDSWEIVKNFSTKPVEKLIPFEAAAFTVDFIDQTVTLMVQLIKILTIEESKPTLTDFLRDGYAPLPGGKRFNIKNLLLQVLKQHTSLGPYGGMKTSLAVYVTLQLMMLKTEDKQSKLILCSLLSSLSMMRKQLDMKMSHIISDSKRSLKCSSHKVQVLVQLLMSHREKCQANAEPMRALVFVQERMTAKILCSVLKSAAKESSLSFMRPAFMVGGTFDQNETLEAMLQKQINENIVQGFRDGAINVLVCSDVLEEGIDIPLCNMVVKFDPVLSFRSYIQSKGRARHQTSSFYLMVESGDYSNYSKKLVYFNQVEAVLKNMLIGKTLERESPTEDELDSLYETEVPPYYTPSGSKVTLNSAVQLVNGYCMGLSRDRFTRFMPCWGQKRMSDSYVVCVQLPTTSPFRDIIESSPMSSLKVAKRAAALELAKQLHISGELDDNLERKPLELSSADTAELFPLWREEEKGVVKSGTNAQIRPYKIHRPECLKTGSATSTWYVHQLKMLPIYMASEGQPEEIIDTLLLEKKSFALLSSRELPEVGDFPVFSKYGEIRLSVKRKFCCKFTAAELNSIQLYHFHLLTSIVSIVKPFMYLNKVDGSQGYLLVPTIGESADVKLDWKTINSSQSQQETVSDIASPESYVGCVVRPTHRSLGGSEAYLVTQVLVGKNAMSPFPDKNNQTYVDYFREKHNCRLVCPQLPLVEVIPLSLQVNAMLPRNQENKPATHKRSHWRVNLPLELCRKIPVHGSYCLQATYLPSVLYRLERLLLANELRQTIACGTGIGAVDLPPGMIWNALESRSETSETPSSEPESDMHRSVKAHWITEKKSTRPVRKKRKSCVADLLDYEPVDLDRDFENITAEDLFRYIQSTSVKTSVIAPPSRTIMKRMSGVTVRSPPAMKGEGIIKCLNPKSVLLFGPHPCDIYEAITAASANDIVNYERMETLGDSFLKFAVSFFLFLRFPDMSEGRCTQLKGRQLGNRNLFYCAEDKGIGKYLKVCRVVPWETWTAPCFHVPPEILKQICENPKKGRLLKNLNLSNAERVSGVIHPPIIDMFNNFCSEEPFQMNLGLLQGVESAPDKCVADVVEALIGVYLLKGGPTDAIKILEWFQILPRKVTETLLTRDILSLSPNVIRTTLAPIDGAHHLEARLGYKFKNPQYLREAVTHCSFPANCESYERLEFLGDALLDFLTTAYIFENCGMLTPGELTDLRSALVNNVTFACWTVRNGFYKYLMSASPALLRNIDKFVTFQEDRDHIIDDEVLILLEEDECRLAETVDVPKALGDMFEALAGAVFLDCGQKFSTVWSVFYRLMKTEIAAFSKNVPKQVVRRLRGCRWEAHIPGRNGAVPDAAGYGRGRNISWM